MSYEQKYLKYKQKYLELKKQLEMNGGALSTTNDISVNTESVLNLSETPRQQTGGFLGLFKSSETAPESQPEQAQETELRLTETPGAPAAPAQETLGILHLIFKSNQKIYTEVNLGPESNMKNVVLSDTPTQEQVGAGFFNGLFDNTTQDCAGTVNTVPVGAVGSQPMAAAQQAAAEQAAAQAAAEQAAAEEAARVAAEQEAARVAAEQAAAEQAAAEQAAAQAAAEQVAPVAPVEAPVEAAPVDAAPVEAPAEAAPVEAPVEAATQATSKYSVSNSEINNTEDIEKLFSQLGGNYSEFNDLIDASSSSMFSSESDSSLTVSEDELLEQL